MKNILFLNHKQKQCGVYQYGYRSAMILKKSKEYNFIYCEVEDIADYEIFVKSNYPDAIIYNYHPATMPWINYDVIKEFQWMGFKRVAHLGIHHEGNETMGVGFDNLIIIDSSSSDSGNNFVVPRPLFENINYNYIAPCSIPAIGSFGFGFNNKGFERLVKLVTEQFDEALIMLNIPFAHYGDISGMSAKAIAKSCSSLLNKNIYLNISHDFLTDDVLLYRLSSNTINVFLYDEMPGRGLSSAIDYALSVKVPIAISKTTMFRHISNTSPSICVEDRSIKEIIESGSEPLQQYRDMWSNLNFIKKYEYILYKTL